MDDKTLLRLLRRDGDAGLAAALELYGGAVKRVVDRVLYDCPEDAEEIAADVFFRLWLHRRKLKNTPLRPWLLVTARNAAIDRLRKLLRSRTVPLTDELAEVLAAPDERQGAEILDALLPADREIFLRKYFYLETSAEIAAATGRTENDVNVRLSRGRKKLKESVLKEGESCHE